MRVEWFCCSCLLRFVPENSRPIRPNLHTQNNWHLRVCWHNSFGLAKASKFVQQGGTWFATQQRREMPGSIFYIQIVGDENHRFSVPKKTMASLPTTTVLLTHSVGCKKWSGSPQFPQKWQNTLDSGLNCFFAQVVHSYAAITGVIDGNRWYIKLYQ